MKQDEFERLDKIITEMEGLVKDQSDQKALEAIRAGVGILERFVVAIEKIAAQGEERVIVTADSSWPDAPGGPVT